ncbi:MAG: hypothetical protein ABIJ47_06985 [Candidatus Bathyarchaeota archaeon]
MKEPSYTKPFTIYRPEYFEILAKEVAYDYVQLEANLEYLANLKGGKKG